MLHYGLLLLRHASSLLHRGCLHHIGWRLVDGHGVVGSGALVRAHGRGIRGLFIDGLELGVAPLRFLAGSSYHEVVADDGLNLPRALRLLGHGRLCELRVLWRLRPGVLAVVLDDLERVGQERVIGVE